mmetsp:Transcript_11000/g.20569  ORF Transcript_11000/g.20569 Transcript_11000/m.20569 type:complete len:108 (-) Transcript_11000:770-1093(-)
MARRYDSSTTTFSPEGRLHQVEYAIEAINNAGTSVGILAKDGVVMASEKKVTSGLLAPARTSEKNLQTLPPRNMHRRWSHRRRQYPHRPGPSPCGSLRLPIPRTHPH